MTKWALSECVKKQKACHAKNTAMRHAIDDYAQDQAKPDGYKKRSACSIAAIHGVDVNTMLCLHRGGTSMSAFNASKQNLTPIEEWLLVDFIKESVDHGFPLNHCNIGSYANAIIQS
jgi:hypothetical protein